MEVRTSRSWIRIAVLGLALQPVAAQSSVYGPLDNFDVVNDTGHDLCGFEIEIEGVHSADVYRTFEAPYIRYGTPTLTDTATGVVIRYAATWDAASQAFSPVTPPAAPGYVPADDSCWTGGLGSAYETTGCEHFGVSQTTQATATHYRWLDCGPGGTLPPLPEIGLPTPTWTVAPPAQPQGPPVVRAEFPIPNPQGDQYGEAYWVKVYKTEAEDGVDLEQLLLDDALMAAAETEIEWELLQAKPGQPPAANEAELGDGAEAVLRRYEFYHYATDWGLANGYVDPENGEVTECVVNGCNDPTLEELGGYVGRQMVAFNIAPTACNNGVDDDGDGAADAADVGCRDATGKVEDPQCQDGRDNGGDAGVDFDGGASANGGAAIAAPDPRCSDPWLQAERRTACGLGAELPFVFAALAPFLRRIRA